MIESLKFFISAWCLLILCSISKNEIAQEILFGLSATSFYFNYLMDKKK